MTDANGPVRSAGRQDRAIMGKRQAAHQSAAGLVERLAPLCAGARLPEPTSVDTAGRQKVRIRREGHAGEVAKIAGELQRFGAGVRVPDAKAGGFFHESAGESFAVARKRERPGV